MTFIAAMILSLVPQDQDRIQELIQKLGSDEFSTRERASEELKKAGKAAREALQKAAEGSDDPEVRQRAKDILEEMAKAPAPRKMVPAPVPAPPPFPVRPGVRAGSVSVRSVNGDTTYTITPADASPALTFHKSAAGAVKLTYPDEKGEYQTVDAASVESLVKDHAELAQKFGISEEGIDYAGSRVSFKGTPFAIPRGFAFPQRPGRLAPPAPLPSEEPERTTVAGAWLAPVDESVRAQLDIPEGQGAVVTKVAAGGIAEALGLRRNDVLLEVDGRKIDEPESAKGLIKKDSSVVVLRKGKRETLPAKKDY
jgi:hypothetical protein